MKSANLKLKPGPRYTTNANGKPTKVTLAPADYVALLVRGNVTDPEFWPPGMQEGAAALARVREMERKAVARHGKFDWEKLSTRQQNEYDDLCALLDRLQDTGERISFEDYKARRAASQR